LGRPKKIEKTTRGLFSGETNTKSVLFLGRRQRGGKIKRGGGKRGQSVEATGGKPKKKQRQEVIEVLYEGKGFLRKDREHRRRFGGKKGRLKNPGARGRGPQVKKRRKRCHTLDLEVKESRKPPGLSQKNGTGSVKIEQRLICSET